VRVFEGEGNSEQISQEKRRIEPEIAPKLVSLDHRLGGCAVETGERGGTALIDNNTIHDVGQTIPGGGDKGNGIGISVSRSSFATIVNNTIRDNPLNGIVVFQSSSARIGHSGGLVASPNTIQNNAHFGVVVSSSSSARIVGNTISNNGKGGIGVGNVSHADISANTIDTNADDGIVVGGNSGVNLGNDTGTTILDLPNDTTVGSENGTAGGDPDFGIRCSLNSYADGRLGTLNGIDGAKGGFSSSCHDSLL
jgi:parallel beta-helix repeat protein